VKVRSVLELLLYTFRHLPLSKVAIVLPLISVGVELLALSLVFPLAETAAGRNLQEGSFWAQLLSALGLPSMLPTILGLFLFLLFFRALTLFVSQLVITQLWRRLISMYCTQAFETFVRTLTFQEIHKRNIGYFTNIAGDEANRAAQIVVLLLRLCPALILTSIYFITIAYQSFLIATAVLMFLAVAAIAFGLAMRKTRERGAISTEQSRELNSHFLDTLNSLRSVRAMNAEEFVTERYRQMLIEYANTNISIDSANLAARFGPVLLLIIIALAWFLTMGLSREFSSSLSFFVLMIFLLMRFFPALGQLVDIALRLVADLKAGEDVSQVLARRDTWLSQKNLKPISPTIGPIKHVRFHNVSFSYRPGEVVLNNIDLEFNSGKSYAIVGPSGVGKSTIVDLLLRFYSPESGQIRVNEVDINNIELEELRSKITIVEQQARIFNDTVFNNISFGRKATQENVAIACEQAGIDKDILRLSNSYHTKLSYQGGNLSGGQRQRIVLARGLLQKSDVLILDEITNGLDDLTKKNVLEQIINKHRLGILIFITHDPYVMSIVDMVFQINEQNNVGS
jgi:ABC-type bacteriocin/lantibiotic exporter with double-glycine peptidase domain